MLNKINSSSQRQKLIAYVVLTVVTIAIFWQVNQFDFINMDDNIYVTNNSHVQAGITLEGVIWAFTTTYAEFWHPLTWISLMLDYQLYGLNPGGFHLTNVILHILSTLLLFRLFNRMTGTVWESAFVSAFFALHPLRVESVAWVSERKDVLSVFFWMLTLCLYVYYTRKPVIGRYLLVLFCFICGLMSKPMVVTLPVVMILLDYWPLGRFESHKGNVILLQFKEKFSFFILSAVFSIITLYAQYNPATEIIPLSYRLTNALNSLVIYLGQILMPYDLVFLFSIPKQINILQTLTAFIFTVAISNIVIVNVKRFPYLFVGWIWYIITILPILGITHIGIHWRHDLYTYLPSIGIAVMMTWGITSLVKSEKKRKFILFPVGIAVLTIMALLAWKQCGHWRDSISLYSHDILVTSNNYISYHNLASELNEKGKIMEAIDNYNNAIHIRPDSYKSYHGRGTAYDKLGQYQRAIADYNETIRLNADYGTAYNDRGTAYGKLGQYQHAIADFNEAIRLKPHLAAIYNNRGFAYFLQGNKKLGCSDAQKACELGECRLSEWAEGKGYCR